jgi:hypothetical protein
MGGARDFEATKVSSVTLLAEKKAWRCVPEKNLGNAF